MQLNFTILLIAICIVFVCIIYNKQINNRMQFNKKNKKYENYYDSALNKPIDLSVLLGKFNEELPIKKINNIEKHSSFGKGNFTENIKLEVMPIINRVLNNINTLGNLRVKFTELDRIEKLQDNCKNTQYLVAFFVSTVDTSVSSKLIINFHRDKDSVVNVNSIKKESDTLADVPNLTDNLITYTHIPKENGLKQYKRTGILDDNQTNDTSYGAPLSSVGNPIEQRNILNDKFIHEPCHYNLHIWDSRGVNKRLKLRDRCRMTNNSQKLAPVHLYANPTVFSPILNIPFNHSE